MTDPENIFQDYPKACIDNCPRLRPLIENITILHALSDYMLQVGVVDNPELSEDMPAVLVGILGEATGNNWNPENAEDREKVVQFIAGNAYEGINSNITEHEAELKKVTDNCGTKKGPLKARIPTDQGKMLVRICRADISSINCPHDHPIIASLQRETN